MVEGCGQHFNTSRPIAGADPEILERGVYPLGNMKRAKPGVGGGGVPPPEKNENARLEWHLGQKKQGLIVRDHLKIE